MDRKELIPYLEIKLQDSNLFKTIYKYVAPPFNTINNFPAVALTYNETKIDNSKRDCCLSKRRRDVYFNIVVYNKAQNKSIQNYEDSLGELLEGVEDILNDILRDDTDIIDIEVVRIKDDEGLVYPYQVALVLTKFKI